MLSIRPVSAILVVFAACGEVVPDSRQNVGGSPSAGQTNTMDEVSSGKGGSSQPPTTSAGATSAGNSGQPSSPDDSELRFFALSANEDNVVAVGERIQLDSEGNCELDAQGNCRMEGVIYSSQDGRNFRLSATVPSALRDVTYGNGVFVANAPPRDVYVSTDSVNWDHVPLPQVGIAQGLAFGNGIFLAPSPSGAPSLLRSEDGRSWEVLDRELPQLDIARTGARFAAGVFVIWGAGAAFYTTARGDVFTEQRLPADSSHRAGQQFGSLHVVNDRFVSETWYNCCFGETGGPWYGHVESLDGSTWVWQGPERARQPYPIPWVQTASTCISLGPTLMSGPDCAHTSLVPLPRPFRPDAVIEWHGSYVAVGPGILQSKDGLVWDLALD